MAVVGGGEEKADRAGYVASLRATSAASKPTISYQESNREAAQLFIKSSRVIEAASQLPASRRRLAASAG